MTNLGSLDIPPIPKNLINKVLSDANVEAANHKTYPLRNRATKNEQSSSSKNMEKEEEPLENESVSSDIDWNEKNDEDYVVESEAESEYMDDE
ncbi:hypothetical protein RFI_03425 [Reticulomyxa filosa]|uniref:Uncharacterized protein n=1 Tax=Reticulomyxa filosa TaxID=46433 RepID=X6P6F8_RETFI|nr:hypothetical protein RFI_03425 [Reticulomyxa filosa]|eukprot:ETO33674.1 hypothetical protein RFI_03425 [Reticulomyxa filosa]